MTRGERRDAKRQKAKYGMQVSGRSVQRLQEITVKKAADPRKVTPTSRKKRRGGAA